MAISASGCLATAVLTALTAQKVRAVAGIHPVSSDFVKSQIEAVVADLRFDVAKVS